MWNPESGEYDTYLSQVDGSERQLVGAGVHQPAFSPDGDWLAVNGEQSLRENLLLWSSLGMPVGTDGTEFGGADFGVPGRYLSAGPSASVRLVWYW